MLDESKETSRISPSTIFLLYEPGQVEELERLFRKRPKERDNSLIIAFSLDIEEKLKEKDIIFYSISRYKKLNLNLLTIEDEMMARFFSEPHWKEFNYCGIELKTIFKFPFRAYLQRVLYYGKLIVSVLDNNPLINKLILFVPSGVILNTSGLLAQKELWAMVDCAKIVAKFYNLEIAILPLSSNIYSLSNFVNSIFFYFRRMIFSIFISIWNVVISVIRHPVYPRLLISDHWKNIGSSIRLLEKGECIFFDRTEIQHIGWKFLLRYRIRFVHSQNFLSRKSRKRSKKSAEELSKQWDQIKSKIPKNFVYQGCSFDSLLLLAIDDIVHNFEKIMQEIEGVSTLYEKFQPNVIILRASVSGQTHFSVLSLVAKKYGIPSLELQHGLEYLGPGSWSREHTAEYLAVYGSIIKKEFVTLGYDSEKVREIGSPRFDSYCPIGSGKIFYKEIINILCIAPDIALFEIYDSYSVEKYFKMVAKTIKSTKNVNIIIKLRPQHPHETLLRLIINKSFSGISYTIIQESSQPRLFYGIDIVISGYSTMILEAIQCGIPVVIPVFNQIDSSIVNFHFSSYCDFGALMITFGYKEFEDTISKLISNYHYRENVSNAGLSFLSQNFSFDGHSADRFIDLIAELCH